MTKVMTSNNRIQNELLNLISTPTLQDYKYIIWGEGGSTGLLKIKLYSFIASQQDIINSNADFSDEFI